MGLLDNKPQNSPSGLPTASTIQAAVRLWSPDPTMFRLSQYFPSTEADAQIVEWEEEDPITGLAQGREPGTPVPMVTQRGTKTRDAKSFFIEEGGEIGQREFERRRRTSDPTALAGEEPVMKLAEQLTVRRQSRKEWMMAQAISNGSVTFNGRTVDYNIPSDNKPTAVNLWSNKATGNPIEDIQAWSLLFRGKSSGSIRCMMSMKVAQYLSRNEIMRDLFRQSSQGLSLGPANVPKLLASMVDNGKPMTFEIYDEGYSNEDTGVYVPFLPDDKFVMVAEPPFSQNLGEWVSTPSIANAPPGSYTAEPGVFVIVEDNLRAKERTYLQIQGEYGLVAFKHVNNVVSATIA